MFFWAPKAAQTQERLAQAAKDEQARELLDPAYDAGPEGSMRIYALQPQPSVIFITSVTKLFMEALYVTFSLYF